MIFARSPDDRQNFVDYVLKLAEGVNAAEKVDHSAIFNAY